MSPDRKYVIINKDDVASIDFSKVLETSADTLRYSNDGNKTFVKYEGEKPSFLSGKTEYSYVEISTILDEVGGEWWSDNA